MSSQSQLVTPSIKEKNEKPGKLYKSLDLALNNIFPSQKEETTLQKAKIILGGTIAELSDQELNTYITEFQYLLDSWFDEFEKQIFNQKTLKELLREE